MSTAVFNAKENAERLNRLFYQNNNRPWEQAILPVRITPHIYYVGGTWVGCTLIDTGDGLILIDAGMPFQLYTVFESIRSLGFDPCDIRKLLISHGHYDHCGAARAVAEHTGAVVYGAREDLAAFEGRDPEALRNRSQSYAGFTPDVFFEDDVHVTQGNVSIRTLLTPGHTPGTTSFFFEDCDAGGQRITAALHGGMGINTLVAKTPEEQPIVEALRAKYRTSMETVRGFKVDVTLSNHPAMNNLIEKSRHLSKNNNPFIDPDAWIKMIDHYLELLDSMELNEAAEGKGARAC